MRPGGQGLTQTYFLLTGLTVGARWVLVQKMHSVHESLISFQEAVLAEVMCRPGSHLLGLSLFAYKMGTVIMFPTILTSLLG